MTNRTSTLPARPSRAAFGDPLEREAGVYNTCLAYSDRETPWHGVGVPFKSGMALMDACRAADLFVRVEQAIPMAGLSIVDKNGVPTGQIISSETIKDTTRGKSVSIVRLPHGDDKQARILGTSSDRYTIIQNETLCQIIKPLEKFGRLDTAGVLRNGALFFVAFLADEWTVKIKGGVEKHQTYLIIKNSHLPGAALQIQIAYIRVICMNTWRQADNEAIVDFSFPHTGNIEEILGWAVSALEKVPQRKEAAKTQLMQLADMEGSTTEFKHWIKKVIPDPAEPAEMMIDVTGNGLMSVPELMAVQTQINASEKSKFKSYYDQLDRRTNLRNLAVSVHGDSPTVHRGTRLGYVEALTETLGHGVRKGGAKRQLPSTAESVMFGERSNWITTGFELALAPTRFGIED